MSRGEKALGGEENAAVRFAAGLRRLREKAGTPSYRELARLAHYSSTTLSDAAGGRRLPTLAVALAFVRACGGDVVEWERRWREVAVEAVGDDVPPYVGLAALRVEDADRFFGRAALVDDLVDRLTRQRFLAVVGASGVGKSSLLRAGLVARLSARPDATTVVMTPGERPVERLAAALPDQEAVVVIDQFEEVFTLCHDHDERARYIADVVRAAERHRVVLGLRADFFAHCADYPELRAVLGGAQVLVGAMTSEELRQVVVEPAERAGCTVEGALVAAVVADAAGRAAALPLVSHALLETWRRRTGNVLTLADYRTAGGIEGALTQTAEDCYTALDSPRRELARGLFLRLTALGEGTEDTKRRISRDELDTDDPDTAAVLANLADARLVTLDETSVELTHEALITAWPRLHRWLVADRDDLRTHRRLTEAVHMWRSLGCDPGALYRGAQLEVAREWADRDGHRLSPVERAFLDASVELRDRERKAATRRVRQLRWLTACLVALLAVVTGITFVAVEQRHQAVEARKVAVSRQLAAQARTLADTRPDTAMLLSVEALRTSPTAEARGAVLGMSARAAYRTQFTAHAQAVSEVAFAPDGNLVTAGKDHAIGVWDAARGRRLATLTEHDTWLRALAVSPDGSTLASGGDDQDVVLWHAGSRVRTAILTGHTGAVKEAVFSPDGRLLATGGTDDAVIVWDVARRTAVARLVGHGGGGVNSVAFSPDGRVLAAAGAGRVVVVWDVASATPVRTLTGHTDVVHKVVFSRDGALASAGRDATVRIWHADGSSTALTGPPGTVFALAFSPDGGTLASAGSETGVHLWDVRHGTLRAHLTGHRTNVYTVAFGPGATLASADESGTVVLWDTDRIAPVEPAAQNDVAFSPDGGTLAVATNDHVTLWDARRRTRRVVLPGGKPVYAVAYRPDGTLVATAGDEDAVSLWTAEGTLVARLGGHGTGVLDLAFSPDGRTLVTGGVDSTTVVWDIATRARLATLTSQTGPIDGVAFSPDGGTLATSAHDTTVVLWNTADWTPRTRLSGHQGWVRNAVFSPDGRTLATASYDSTVRLWDVASGAQQVVLTDHVDALVSGVAFSPDGTTLSYTSSEHAVTLWHRESGTVSARLVGHAKPVRAVAFSPDGATLVTAGEDDAVLLWDTDPGRAAQRICAGVGRGLTDDERRQFVPDGPRAGTC
ncbi:MAG: helix-turn-helix domain-containing protein [Saccharothrix sp.]|nr:helix-turn-helix domain-containing protein [Saccharothrix sp.]